VVIFDTQKSNNRRKGKMAPCRYNSKTKVHVATGSKVLKTKSRKHSYA
jgi:hypothetical protein